MLNLKTRTAHGGEVIDGGGGRWKLRLPVGPAGEYRWAQLDDHLNLRRGEFPWKAPVHMQVRARVSRPDLAGTWGFGLWNDPFTMGLGIGGTRRGLPALPNAAWFFFASAPNYLAFHDNHPAQGYLAATFASLPIPTLLLTLGVPFAPLLLLKPTARLLRRVTRLVIRDTSVLVQQDVTQWHTYELDWLAESARFFVDGEQVYQTPVTPSGRLGFVLWIDNQYAAFPPDGKIGMGTLATEGECWMEVEDLQII